MKKTATSTRVTGMALSIVAALIMSACASDPGGPQSAQVGGPGNEAPGNEAPDSQAPGNEAPDNEAPDNEAPDSQAPGNEAPDDGPPDPQSPDSDPDPVVGGPHTAVVQVGNWSHTYAIPDHLSDMCSVKPEFSLLTVRDMRDDTEFFEWKFDEPGYNGIAFAVESAGRFYIAGESHTEHYADALEYFGVTTPVPAATVAMFEVTSGSAHGTVDMLDILADAIVTVTIHITCD